MDRSTEWPWSWEEEVEWKADLEERDYAFLQDLIDNAVEELTAEPLYGPESSKQETLEDSTLENYLVTA